MTAIQPLRHVRHLGWLLCLLVNVSAQAEIRLPAIFSEHMVLQRDQKIPIWGWADPGEHVVVELSRQVAVTTADESGLWKTEISPLPAGGPYALRVRPGVKIEPEGIISPKDVPGIQFADVWVGEVWLCSGQSNMAMTVSRAANYEQEQASAIHPKIRMFTVASKSSPQPEMDCTGTWTICSPETVGRFSATAYFFARELQASTGIPVGLINSSVGGTPIEAWVREEVQREIPELASLFTARDEALKNLDPEAAKARHEKAIAAWREAARKARAEGKPVPRAPQDPVALARRKNDIGGLYNGMIAPVIEYGFRGVLWYQGEANSTPEKAGQYRSQLAALVNDWRAQHGAGEFPVAWVQLPNFAGNGRNWPVVREAMLKSLEIPQTGMAITLDIGETGDIHPKNKQEVGRRLALWARATVHRQKVVPIGPLYSEFRIDGSAIKISFRHGDGLQWSEGPEGIHSLAIAGADKMWYPAQGKIVDGMLVVSSPEVQNPAAVRYGWANDPPSLLTNRAGLPASPFRTDDWDDVTPFD